VFDVKSDNIFVLLVAVSSKISCDDDEMRVEVKGSNITEAYLLGLKNYPGKSEWETYVSLITRRRVSNCTLNPSMKSTLSCNTLQELSVIYDSSCFFDHHEQVKCRRGDKETARTIYI